MKKVAFSFKLKEESVEEYVEKHRNVWDEMKKALKDSGRSNYSIWLIGNLVFGYYEVEDIEKSKSFLLENEFVKKWNAEIIDLVEKENAVNGQYAKEMEMVFNLD